MDWMTGRWHKKYFPKFIIQWTVVGSLIKRLPVRRFSTSVVAACGVVVLGDFAHEVELETPLVRRGGFLGELEHYGGRGLFFIT